MKTFIGIDNGTSGSIGVLGKGIELFISTPTKKEQNYTKTKANITRLDSPEFYYFLKNLKLDHDLFIALERPLVNPGRFRTTINAVRCLEAQLNVIEILRIPYRYIDSKEWQKALLPKGIKGSVELKKASMDISCRLFPNHKEFILKHKDGDGLLIAEYLRKSYND